MNRAAGLRHDGRLAWSVFVVEEEETIEAAGETFETVRVRTAYGTAWLATRPPYLIKRKVARGPSVWKLESATLEEE